MVLYSRLCKIPYSQLGEARHCFCLGDFKHRPELRFSDALAGMPMSFVKVAAWVVSKVVEVN